MVLTDEQKSFISAVRAFCAKEAGTIEQRDALSDDRRAKDNVELTKKLAGMGWLGISLPEEYGGSGRGLVDELLFLEETERALLPIHGYSTAMTMGGYYLSFGTEEQKQQILPGIPRGMYGSIALSEPEAGSDLAASGCKAVRDGEHYVLNGQKTWISEAHLAEYMLVLVRTDSSGDKHRGLSMITVPTDLPGIEVRPINTMGAHIVNDVFFSDCRVPASGVVGGEGNAWSLLTQGLAVERLYIGAMSLGLAQRCFEDAISYLKQRQQFGRPIGSFQVLKHRAADMATELEAMRALLYDVAQMIDLGLVKDANRQASMVKLKATTLGRDIAIECMHMMGGAGYTRDFEMEFHLRTALAPPVYGGSSEIQRGIISKSLGL
ncbi:acyl-CoA dehydrogenase family protein [Nocardioides acrostichi]|uniref:Acyl-CoA/acyl-ACP dehydrogenase n=1 Tax=Nocardioides acrostichi TaxID=2784339 RepID=A0A930UXC4_9ACTN|nr:acyl-CoA dehydrogenase family protein [Nocardioides acrostichi]MBF4160795.1 acyl-CoA/acyl-ACP dehydrogenase [Nocardioides acrostichi]